MPDPLPGILQVTVELPRDQIVTAAAKVRELIGVQGTRGVYGPSAAPDGLTLLCDLVDAPARPVLSLLRIVSDELGATVTGLVEAPSTSGAFFTPRPALVLEAFLLGGVDPLQTAIRIALDWIGTDDSLWTSIDQGAHALASRSDALGFAEVALQVQTSFSIAAGAFDRPNRAFMLKTEPDPYLALATGWTPADLESTWSDLCRTGRSLGGSTWSAWAAPRPSWEMLAPGADGGYVPPTATYAHIGLIPDLALVAPSAWQLIGPGHRARLAGSTDLPPPSPADGELVIGAIHDWADPAQSARQDESARRRLDGLLLTMPEASNLYEARLREKP